MKSQTRQALHQKTPPRPVQRNIQSSVTAKGQTTIPKSIRDHLRLKPGDRVKFFIHPNGTVVLLPKLPASALRGMFNASPATASVEQMHEAVLDGAAARFEQAASI